MIKSYFYLFLLLFISSFCLGQDCTIQKVVSDPTICYGENATITLFTSETGVSYQLRQGTTNIGVPQVGNGSNLQFVVSPLSTTTYSIFAYYGPTSCTTTLIDQSTITVTPLPTATISYAGTPFCTSEGVQTVTLNGTGTYTGGTFTAPAGLSINASTGTITPSSSTAGTYTVTYTIPANGGCAAVSVTTSATIALSATASISYASSAFCEKSGSYDIALSGTADYTGGTYTASPAGLIIDPDTGRINTGGSTAPGTYTVTYTIPARGVCPAITATTSVTITAKPTATISYAGNPFCNSLATEQNVTLTGTAAYIGGIFSAPPGLFINAVTGSITPGSSTAGTYTVTYTIPASGGCAAKNVTTNVTITALPTAVISYAGTPFCTSVTTGQNVTLSGTAAYTGGTYTVSPVGLTINPISGAITPSTSAAGAYTITYTVPASGGCAAVSVTTSVTITKAPTATISYAGTPFCNSTTGMRSVTLNGTEAYTGGTFSAPAGLTINAITGEITPSTSTAGTYTVTYTIPANGGCAAIPVTTNITITAIPTAVISYAGIPLCTAVTTAQNVTLSGTGAYTGGTYSAAPAGLTINPSTGAITPSTSTAGTYTITYAIPASGGCAAVSVTTSVTITSAPTATISYAGTPFCKSIAGTQSATLNGTGVYTGGSFSASPAGLSIDATTGDITPSSSTPGTYTVTYTISASNNCIDISVTTSITITDIPTAVISYAGTPFSTSVTTGQNVTLSGTGAYTGGMYTVSPDGLTINPFTGEITPSTSSTGTYTITYAIPESGGCAALYVTTGVTIINTPTATISYTETLFCKSIADTQSVTLNGTGAYTGGSFSASPTGLYIDATTGDITPNSSLAGTYIVTYTKPASLDCAAIIVTTSITIIALPTAVISQNQTVCNGGTATFSVALTGTGPWELTYFNGTTSTTVTDILTSPYVFSVENMTNTETYAITYLKDSKCTAISSDITGSATVTVLNEIAGLWTGLVSTDWFDSMNWACGLPSATIDAVIPAGTTRMPVIDPLSPFAATNGPIAIARDVIIATNASITMVANSDLHVKRDWRNSGNFMPSTGTVTFNGDTAGQVQLINSGINLNETFYNLTLNCTNGAKGINVADAFQLTVANNLVLTSGDLRLTGEAQLVQNGTGANPSGGTGVLLRDQQGTKSSYHYNYWSSPVSADNLSYTIGGVLKDGTNAVASPFSQDPINFGWGYDFADGPLTSPIKISNRWLYKYTMISTSYYSWQLIGNIGSVMVGEGFTMKGVTGSEPNTNYQNYTFVGKPNNGTISLTMAPNQLYLIGNPYPSALDADEFIKDNILDGGRATSNVFNGALYFWDHFGGTTHYLAQYVGGYATYNLMGGVAAISSDPIINNNNTSGSKEPKRYIPVAQGFFIRTDLTGATGMLNPISGGTVTFKNSQRAFKTELPSSSIFIRNENLTVGSGIDNRQKIRLSFESPSGVRRQLLVGADPQATDNFDMGYDAPMIDVNQDDMYWIFSEGKFVIQALSDFNIDQVIPLGIKVSTAGTTKIKIDELENIPASTEIYLFDSLSGLYHDIKNEDFTSNLAIGEYRDRFSLRFTAETLSIEDIIQNSNIMVFADANHFLNIKNNFTDNIIEVVLLYNILGQSIAKWNVADKDQRNIKIPVENIRSGTYIVKLKTSDGSLSKKVIIR